MSAAEATSVDTRRGRVARYWPVASIGIGLLALARVVSEFGSLLYIHLVQGETLASAARQLPLFAREIWLETDFIHAEGTVLAWVALGLIVLGLAELLYRGGWA